jgi:hypothetical protein
MYGGRINAKHWCDEFTRSTFPFLCGGAPKFKTRLAFRTGNVFSTASSGNLYREADIAFGLGPAPNHATCRGWSAVTCLQAAGAARLAHTTEAVLNTAVSRLAQLRVLRCAIPMSQKRQAALTESLCGERLWCTSTVKRDTTFRNPPKPSAQQPIKEIM